jgi:predicted short-subunit dehydrogenase-like oxidoreductase (DUF2520 family)
MRIIVVGPGRAGLSVAAAAQASGHVIAAVVGKSKDHAASAAASLGAAALATADDLPLADLMLVATRDDAIPDVAADLAPHVGGAVAAAAHLSGLKTVSALAPLADAGCDTGSFHPLQTLPSPEAGAARLSGAWVAVTADEPLRTTLHELARSVGAHPFDLADGAKALYHAGAAAAANFPLLALTMASDLFSAAGVPFAAARPLVEAVVANAFALGPRPALTGPVARGDLGTVAAQLDAVAAAAPEWVAPFAAGVLHLAGLAGRGDDFRDLLERWRPPPHHERAP